MIFSSIFFLFVFLPVTLVLYFVLPWKLKNTLLLIVSLIFYAWGEPVYVFLMLFSIVFNYISGIEIHRYREENNQRFLRFSFWFTVAVNLAGLPAVCLPCAMDSKGLPIGMQLIGDCFQEKKILETAAVYEKLRGPFPVSWKEEM